MSDTTELLLGTLDLLILKAVSLGPLHGYGVLLRIQQISRDRLQIRQGSLYPALYRLEHQGLIDGDRALLAPGMFTAGAGQGFGLDQRLGQHSRLLPLATHLAEADLLAGAQRLFGGGSKPVRHLGAGQALMHQHREFGESGGAS